MAEEFSFSEIIAEIQGVMKELTKLNIIVAGKTGTGKSTLINTLFKERLAHTGVGMPVTQHICRLEKQDVPLTVYDTRGLELGGEAQNEVFREIKDIIAKRAMNSDIDQKIHCLLYCVNTASNRIEEAELEWLKNFTAGDNLLQVPVIIVLTQAFSKKRAKEMKALIEAENLSVAQVVTVLAESYEIDEEHTVAAYGLDVLIEVLKGVLPEELEITLQNVQIASVREKVKLADKYVSLAASSAAAAAATPLPFSDAVALVPIQVGMIAKITAVFGIDVSANVVAGVVSSLAGSVGATVAGKRLAAALLKIVPGGGTLAGGAISAITASAMTLSLGKAYIKLMEKVMDGQFDLSDVGSAAFCEELKKLLKEE